MKITMNRLNPVKNIDSVFLKICGYALRISKHIKSDVIFFMRILEIFLTINGKKKTIELDNPKL